MSERMTDPLGRGMHGSYGFLLKRWVSRSVSHIVLPQEIIGSIRDSVEKNIAVYVMPSASSIDYLLLNFLCEKYDFPKAAFATDVPFFMFQPFWKGLGSGLRQSLSLRKQNAPSLHEERQLLQHALSLGRSVCLFLKKPGMFRRPDRWHVLLWEQLLSTQRKIDRPISVIPVEFVWNRSPGSIHAMGPPTPLWKIRLLTQAPQSVEAKVGKPIPLVEFLESVSENRPEIQAKKLRRLLASRMYRERRVLTGPPTRYREKVIERVLKDLRLQKTIQDHALRKRLSEKDVLTKVRKILREMVANYKPSYVATAYPIVRWIQHRLYQRIHVDHDSLERIKLLARDHSILYLPCHRSHLDYIFLSKIYYEEGLIPPHIAAGVNLSFFPMGLIFRNTGAFFIRRKVSGDILYARTLASYIRWLIRAGHSQEFFIEGTRSRTGKLQSPKVGLLSNEVDACLEQKTKDLLLIPVAITYDRVPEESEYRRESQGSEKVRENWWGLLRARKFLRRRHGEIFVRFCDSISTLDFFRDELRGQRPAPKEKIHALAKEVVAKIARGMTVTTASLVSTCVLSRRRAPFTVQDLQDIAPQLRSLFKDAGAPLAPNALQIEAHLRSAVDFFESSRWIARVEGHPGAYRVDPRHVFVLDFHKNASMHFLLPAILGAFERLFDEQSWDDPLDRIAVRAILEHEFPYAPKASVETPRRLDATLLACARNYLEAYWIASVTLLNAERALGIPEFLAAVDDSRRDWSEHVWLTCPEASSHFLLKSAYEYFQSRWKLDPLAIERMKLSLEKILVEISKA